MKSPLRLVTFRDRPWFRARTLGPAPGRFLVSTRRLLSLVLGPRFYRERRQLGLVHDPEWSERRDSCFRRGRPKNRTRGPWPAVPALSVLNARGAELRSGAGLRPEPEGAGDAREW